MIRFVAPVFAALIPALAAPTAVAQDSARAPAPQPARVYRQGEVLAVTLRADLATLYRDRDPDTSIWREGTFTFPGAAGPVAVPVRVRTRGLYRLRNCAVPPIRLRFLQDSVRGTLLSDARRPKLVTHCQERGEFEQNLLQEYAIYRVWQLLTPYSFAVRLLRVTYEDASGSLRPVTRYALLTEDPEQFAERMGGELLTEGQRFSRMEPAHAALLGVFQYFIANTDWSVPGMHNVEQLRTPAALYGIPYDFDWAGVIGASYARPAELLPIRSVHERIYRGFCQGGEAIEPVLARFESLRDSIAAVYRSIPGLEPRTVERTLRYYDEFYRAVSDRQRFVERVVGRDCIP